MQIAISADLESSVHTIHRLKWRALPYVWQKCFCQSIFPKARAFSHGAIHKMTIKAGKPQIYRVQNINVTSHISYFGTSFPSIDMLI